MTNTISNKDDLLQLLKKGEINKFNEVRLNNEDSLLDLTELDLAGYDLMEVDLSNADLSGSDFCEADLSESKFTNSDLTSVNFSRAVLKQADFSKSILAGTKFKGANASESDFAEADMNGADLSDTDLTDADLSLAENLSQCIFDSDTIWPDSNSLPEDFDTEYIEDLSSLQDEDDYLQDDFAY